MVDGSEEFGLLLGVGELELLLEVVDLEGGADAVEDTLPDPKEVGIELGLLGDEVGFDDTSLSE